MIYNLITYGRLRECENRKDNSLLLEIADSLLSNIKVEIKSIPILYLANLEDNGLDYHKLIPSKKMKRIENLKRFFSSRNFSIKIRA